MHKYNIFTTAVCSVYIMFQNCFTFPEDFDLQIVSCSKSKNSLSTSSQVYLRSPVSYLRSPERKWNVYFFLKILIYKSFSTTRVASDTTRYRLQSENSERYFGDLFFVVPINVVCYFVRQFYLQTTLRSRYFH